MRTIVRVLLILGFYRLLKKKCLVEVFPIDGWDCWGYKITLEDAMSPMFVAFSSNYDEFFSSHDDAFCAGIVRAKSLIL